MLGATPFFVAKPVKFSAATLAAVAVAFPATAGMASPPKPNPISGYEMKQDPISGYMVKTNPISGYVLKLRRLIFGNRHLTL